ncbi:MAG TPA: protein arginine kinase [Longimicrobiales bacterium]|nr:protein arginine kinase [Longimicrobiales bacterium]
MIDPARSPDFGLDWLAADGEDADVVLSTRVRLARNLQGHAYTRRLPTEERRAIFDQIVDVAERQTGLAGGHCVHIADLPVVSRRVLLERHLISRELAGEGDGREALSGSGLLLARDERLSAMVNEEDHLRLQSLLSGLRLEEAFALVDHLDDELGTHLPFAYHPEFGYLTSCPTNAGTGLRASILIHLPGLVLTKEIGKVLQGINQVGLTFRGLYGEGSEVVGNFFQVSNQTTLGKSEEDLIDHLQKIVRQVIEYERRARAVLRRDARHIIEDKIWRAYGLLRYAHSLSFDEAMNLLSGVRLGVSLKLIPELRVYSLNRMMILSQVAHLNQAAGRVLNEQEADLHRATYVRRALVDEGAAPEEPPATEQSN